MVLWALSTAPATVAKILDHLRLPSTPPPVVPAQAPDQAIGRTPPRRSHRRRPARCSRGPRNPSARPDRRPNRCCTPRPVRWFWGSTEGPGPSRCEGSGDPLQCRPIDGSTARRRGTCLVHDPLVLCGHQIRGTPVHRIQETPLMHDGRPRAYVTSFWRGGSRSSAGADVPARTP